MKPIQCLRKNVDLDMLLRLRGQLTEYSTSLEECADWHALIGNRTRISILWIITRSPARELCPCDLADILGITVGAVSQQLQRLRRGKLLTNRREGKTIVYSLTPEGVDVIDAKGPRKGPSDDR